MDGQWRDVVSAEEIRQLIGDLRPIPSVKKSDVAKRYETAQGDEVGLITSVTEPFCGNCQEPESQLMADFTHAFSQVKGWIYCLQLGWVLLMRKLHL